jgi:hypothetical protein
MQQIRIKVFQVAPPSVNGVPNMSNPEATAEAIESVSNLSFEELVAQRTARQNPEPESEEQTEEEEPESQEEEIPDEPEETETEEEPEEEEEESEIDLLSLTTEQIQSLAKKGKSRLLQRIGELTAQKKALEEKIQSQPRVKELPQDQIPLKIREIQSLDELDAEYEKIETTLELTDELLRRYKNYDDEDIILVGEKEFTKQQIDDANSNSRKALNKYIPAQRVNIQRMAQMEQLKNQYVAAAEEEVPDIKDESTIVGKQFKDLVSDPLIEKLRKQVPEIGHQIEYILAHAANSIHGGTRIKKQPAVGNKLKVSPSPSPFGAGAAKSSTSPKAKATDAYSRFEKSGSPEEWVAARIAKYK